jgi:cell division protein FtsL
MKRFGFCIVLSAAILVVSSGIAQTPAIGDNQRLLALIKEVQTQQAQIEANQANIDTKLAQVAENVRLARIYARRGK